MKLIIYRIILLSIISLYSCGLPDGEPFLEPPKIDKRLNSTSGTLTCSFFNVDEQNEFYPDYLKGFEVYYRIFDPEDSRDSSYIQTNIIDTDSNIKSLVSVASSTLNLSNISKFSDFSEKKYGTNGFFRFFTKNEITLQEVQTHIRINEFTRNRNIKIEFDFNLTNELGIRLEYKYFNSAIDTEGTNNVLYLYRYIANENYETINRLRGFNNNLTEIKEYSFRQNDIDLKGTDGINNSVSKGLVNTEYYVGLWVVGYGFNIQFKKVYSQPIFLGFRKLDVNFSGIKEDANFSESVYNQYFK